MRGKLHAHEAEARRMFEAGKSCAEIGSRFGVHLSGVSRLARARGWKRAKKSAPAKETPATKKSAPGIVPVKKVARGVSGREGDLE